MTTTDLLDISLLLSATTRSLHLIGYHDDADWLERLNAVIVAKLLDRAFRKEQVQ